MKPAASFLAVLFFLNFSSFVYASIEIYTAPAFYNFQKKFPLDSDLDRRREINPRVIHLSDYQGLARVDDSNDIFIDAFKGEVIYKSLILKNVSTLVNLDGRFQFSENSGLLNESNTELSLISSWFQAGKNTTLTKRSQYLTHELLLKDDRSVDLDDSWTKVGTKWYYNPPYFSDHEEVLTSIENKESKRLLLEFQLPVDIDSGHYIVELVIKEISSGEVLDVLNFHINVSDVRLNTQLKNDYDLFIYTKLALDPMVGRKNSFINGQNNYGDDEYQERLFLNNINDIADKGFNGALVLDWRPKYIKKALKIFRSVGLSEVVVYAKPVVKKGVQALTGELVDTIKEEGFEPIFYGYDEPGGNKKREQQLALNEEISYLGAKSMNAIFWDDLAASKAEIKTEGQDFDYLTISMGSHGAKKFLKELPLVRGGPTKYLAYWHPHVENPVRNRLYMGFWLWASGLDGVSPHAYYILPHIARYEKEGLGAERGPLSPYNDFSMWDNPNGNFRQHATVYPHSKGVISTLQWEAITEGVTDLILIRQLEELLQDDNELSLKARADDLFGEIRRNTLTRKSSALSDIETKFFLVLLEEWRARIKRLIIEYHSAGGKLKE